jgi:hypothetical protein
MFPAEDALDVVRQRLVGICAPRTVVGSLRAAAREVVL